MAQWDMKVWGLTLGCVWSAAVLLLGITAMKWPKGAEIVKIFATVYVGYRASLLGSLVGAFWGFIDGAITGVLIAWLRNEFFA